LTQLGAGGRRGITGGYRGDVQDDWVHRHGGSGGGGGGGGGNGGDDDGAGGGSQLVKGSRVTIRGLVAAHHLNGREAVVKYTSAPAGAEGGQRVC